MTPDELDRFADQHAGEIQREMLAKMNELMAQLQLTEYEGQFVKTLAKQVNPKLVQDAWSIAREAGRQLRPVVMPAVYAMVLAGMEVLADRLAAFDEPPNIPPQRGRDQ